MLKNSIIIISLIFGNFVFAQNYSVSNIPDSLRKNANCVIRLDKQEIVLNSINSGYKKVCQAYTILNSNADEMARFVLPYDENESVTVKDITIFDASGKKVKKAKDNEIIDLPAFDGFSLFNSYRVILYKPNYGNYPYTIEFSYEVKQKNLISYGTWQPLKGYNTSIQEATLSLSIPKDMEIRIKELNTSPYQSKITEKGVTYTWTLSNYLPIEPEPLNYSIKTATPTVYLMPTDLVYDDAVGKATTWAEYGKWAYDLYKDRMEVNAVEKNKIIELTAQIPDTTEKIKAVYKYMQNRTRYVSVQIGIGGFQPFSADMVYKTGYGDCKALSNYMHSLLGAIGIKSHPTLVHAGRYIEPIYKDFPNFNQFNHVILCVPMKKDSIWLECTSQTSPFNFLGDFTDNRDVLLLTENGGKFAHTKVYSLNDNLQSSKTEIIIQSSGSADIENTTKYKNLQYDDIAHLLQANYDDQKKDIYKNLDFPSFQLKSFSITKQPEAEAELKINGCSNNYLSFNGKYILMPLNMVNALSPAEKQSSERKREFVINRSYSYIDTLNYALPDGFTIQTLPEEKKIESKFGSYVSKVQKTEKGILYIREFKTKEGHYNASEYKDFYNFTLAVSRADGAKAILTKRE